MQKQSGEEISLIKITKSVYDKPDKTDGERILVMRFWPRGVSREKAKIDGWLKDLGTEKELIKKWKSGKVTWKEFSDQYRQSLKGKEGLLNELVEKSTKGNVTLLCTDRDPTTCHRSILAIEIEKLQVNK
jgi:uncharacterized protein YeaO (DUF488 family)